MTHPVKTHSDDTHPLSFTPEDPNTVALRRPQDRSASGYPARLPD